MSNKNVTLKDTSSNSLFPKTFTQNVFNSSNESIDSSLATINAKLATKIEFSENDIPSATPSALDDYYNKSATDSLLSAKANTTLNNLGTINPTLTSSSVTINGKAGTKKVGGHFVTESWKSTDGTQWYRKWSDGWKEQGGTVSASSDSLITTYFPISFSSTPVVFTNFSYTATGAAYYQYVNAVSITTTYFKTNPFNNYSQGTQWYACGY